MKHFIALLVLAIGSYFAWRYAPNEARKVIKQFLGNHLPWVAFIVTAVFLALAGAFNTRSVNIL